MDLLGLLREISVGAGGGWPPVEGATFLLYNRLITVLEVTPASIAVSSAPYNLAPGEDDVDDYDTFTVSLPNYRMAIL